jgi:hypothetical protein
VNVVADVSIGFAGPLIGMSDPRFGSVASETRYFRAPATGAHVSLNGVDGYLICAPPTGETSVVLEAQLFRIERPRDQAEGVPFLEIARTRHQYVPFGAVWVSVARVFFVRKSSLPLPSTGELKPASAAIWNSYSSAPATAFHAKAGKPAALAPSAGPTGTGVRVRACAGVPPIRTSKATPTASKKPLRPVENRRRGCGE